MSKAELEDRQEREQVAAVASKLGISRNDLDQLDWRMESRDSDDGVHYGWTIYFGESSNPEILSKIKGLNDGRWIWIDPLPEGP